MTESLTISVVVPVYSGGEGFRRCLASLAETRPRPLEIIVVEDGGPDQAAKEAESFGARVIRLPTTGGPARARNLGASLARGEVLLFLDADVTVPPGIIGQVVAIFSEQPDAAAVMGSYDEAPSAENFLSQYKNLLHHYVHQTSKEEASTFWGACGAVRRKVFLEMGGFDESYRWPSVEDIDLGYRLRQAGHRIRLCKELQVKHLKRWGVASLLRSDFLHRALPWTRLILRHGSMLDDLNLRPSSRASVCLAWALAGCLMATAAWPTCLAIALPVALALLAINLPVYRFFRKKRGLLFALRVVPVHWLYYFYSGLAFGIGTVQHLVNKQGLYGFDS
ncbi:MAG: glycosyltransferase [Verrucomicrobiae bacterium]|nr:glycosyltransferase [Verrucomicrobiae bacterium]